MKMGQIKTKWKKLANKSFLEVPKRKATAPGFNIFIKMTMTSSILVFKCLSFPMHKCSVYIPTVMALNTIQPGYVVHLYRRVCLSIQIYSYIFGYIRMAG